MPHAHSWLRFGLCSRVQTVLDDLHSMTLPCPALALLWPETLQTNFEIVSQRFNVVPGQGTRNLASMVWVCLGLFG